jgi:ABC-type antimicrobial peptide transport system permease subunit
VLTAVLAAIGYLVASLMIQTRREEYAVLRILGMSKWQSMYLYFTEMAALTLGGSLVGALVSTAFGIGGLRTGIRMFILFSLCFLLGSVLALYVWAAQT